MRFFQVSELLDWISAFHEALADQYRLLADQTDKERAALLLNYLSDHERSLAESIEKYELDAADSILATWSGQSPELHLPESLVHLNRSLSGKDSQEIITCVIDFHNILIEMYNTLAENTASDSVKNLFENLAQMERHESMRTVRDAQRLEDY